MRRYLNILIAMLLVTFTACTDSPMEDWEPYLNAGQKPVFPISVNKTTITADAISYSESISINTTDTWTATVSDSWITLSATSGSADQTITINLTENTTAKKRTGKVTITNDSGKSAVINISQDGKSMTIDPNSLTFQAEGGSSNITVTANGDYTWNKSEIGTWLTVTKGYTGLSVSAPKNANPDQRTDTVTIYMTGLTDGTVSYDVIVTQFGTEYAFDIDKTIITASSVESSDAINLTTNDSWTAQVSDKWITISATSGTDSQMININLAENKTPTERKGSVIFIGTNSKATKTVEVTQNGKILTVSPAIVSISNAGGSASVTVSTDGTFNPTSSDSWISAQKLDNIVTITAEANPSTTSRTGKVLIELTGLTSGELSQSITVIQTATSYNWTIDPTTLNANSTKETISFTLTTNDEWTVSSTDSWINLSTTSGTGNEKIQVTVSDNASTESRKGTITVKGVNSGNYSTITVNQNGRYLTVDPSSLSFDATGGSSIVNVDTDGTFSVTTSENWITIKTNGNQVNITTTQNEGKTSRNGKVFVKLSGLSNGSLTRNIEITQAGTNYNFSVDKNSLSGSSASWSEDFTLTTNDSWTASCDVGWVKLSKTSGRNTNTLQATMSENTSTGQRTGTITLTGINSGNNLTISVSQEGKYLTVAPSYLNFGTDGGSAIVDVSTDGNFTTSKSDNWITLSTNGNTITVSAAKNTSPNVRTGSVNVSLTGLTSGSITKSIEVTQAAASYTFSIDQHSISATSSTTSENIILSTNDSWTADSDVSWITLSPSYGNGLATVKISLSENKTTLNRSGTITFKGINSGKTERVDISQDGKYMSVSTTSVSFEATGGSSTVTVSTDATFSTSKSDDWITVSTYEKTITITAPNNSGTTTRNGTVTISASNLSSGSLAQTIIVSQAGTDYNFSLDNNNISATSSATTSSIVLSTNDNWTASSSASWVTLSSTSGYGDATLTVKLAENMSIDSRSSTITIKGTNSGSTATVSIVQDGKYLTVSSEDLSFEAEGGSKSVSVFTDGTFATSKSDNWITVSTSGNTITVKAAENTSTSSRTGTVRISLTGLSSGAVSKVISISQSGVPIYAPTVSPSNINKSSAAGTASISVSTNDSWTATSSATWLTLSSSSGTGNATLTVNLSENKATGSRSGTITIKGSNTVSSAIVSVTQNGKYLTVSPTELTFDADGGSQAISVTTDGTFTTSKSATWITVSTSGNTITISASANTSTDSRTGTVVISLSELSSGSLSRTINIKQNAKDDITIDDYENLKPLD